LGFSNAYKARFHTPFLKTRVIKYFIRLKIDNIVLVAVSQLKMVSNIIDKIGGRTRNALIGIKNSGVFEQFYSDIKEIKDKMSNIEK
jgi:hypothetical protein